MAEKRFWYLMGLGRRREDRVWAETEKEAEKLFRRAHNAPIPKQWQIEDRTPKAFNAACGSNAEFEGREAQVLEVVDMESVVLRFFDNGDTLAVSLVHPKLKVGTIPVIGAGQDPAGSIGPDESFFLVSDIREGLADYQIFRRYDRVTMSFPVAEPARRGFGEVVGSNEDYAVIRWEGELGLDRIRHCALRLIERPNRWIMAGPGNPYGLKSQGKRYFLHWSLKLGDYVIREDGKRVSVVLGNGCSLMDPGTVVKPEVCQDRRVEMLEAQVEALKAREKEKDALIVAMGQEAEAKKKLEAGLIFSFHLFEADAEGNDWSIVWHGDVNPAILTRLLKRLAVVSGRVVNMLRMRLSLDEVK